MKPKPTGAALAVALVIMAAQRVEDEKVLSDNQQEED